MKTAVLLRGTWALPFVIGALTAGGSGHSYWIWIFVLIGLFQTGYAYWNSVAMALRVMDTHPASQVQYSQPYTMIHKLAEKTNQPLPSIWIAPTRTPNVFVTGRDPQHATVCCTEGILQILGERELYAVLGHELIHVYSRDIFISSVAAALGGFITSIAQFLIFFGGGRRDNNRGGIGVLATFAMAFLAFLVTSILQFSLLRIREFDADEDGARFNGGPLAPVSTLRKLESGTDQAPLASILQVQNVSTLTIVNPPQGLRNLFLTHPPMDERIARLEKMAGY